MVLLAGGPGSGSRSLCDRIAKTVAGIEHLSVGELLNKYVEFTDLAPNGNPVEEAMDRGELVSEVCILLLSMESVQILLTSAHCFYEQGY